ncbi:MAG TPA: acyl-CoA dehydrogenase family protein [Candidatus Binataceae bacterium]|nr:acyl-CoA dehydrogenase family protein [Candidatus Binataceae bacterium]
MEFVEYDETLTDEQRQIRDIARKFSREVLRPVGIALDKMTPEAMVAPGSPFFSVLRQAHELGFDRMGGAPEQGGLGASPLTQHIVLEELSYGNAGLAGSILLSAFPPEAAMATANPELAEEFVTPHYAGGGPLRIGAWAITEPDHGSDSLGLVRPELRVKGPGQLVARKDGDSWIISGQKSSWVSNGPVATHAVLFMHLEPKSGLERGGVSVLPLNLPGISRGKPLDKHGLRALPQGEIIFDDVRIPRRYMFVEADAYPQYLDFTLTAFNAGVSAMGAGMARAAFDTALAYTKERIQGGRPIFDHQSVRARLFHMFSLVQASQALSRNVYVYNLNQLRDGKPAPLHHSIAAKVFCTDAAFEVATLAVQLHGGNGMTKEYAVEMLLRDATACTIADGENAFLSQVGASML